MSEVAGRLAPQVGAYHLMRSTGGRGVLPGGVPGSSRAGPWSSARGVSGWHATTIALGLGFHVTLLDKDINKLREADKVFGNRVQTVASNAYALEKAVLEADLVIGAVLDPRRQGPQAGHQRAGLPDEARLGAGRHRHRPGRLLRGLPSHHARRTDLRRPRLGLLLRGQHARRGANTSTYALTNATLPYIVELADRGWQEALRATRRWRWASTPMRTGRLRSGRRGARAGLRATCTRCSARPQRPAARCEMRHAVPTHANGGVLTDKDPAVRVVTPLTAACSVTDTSCRVRRIVLLRTTDTP